MNHDDNQRTKKRRTGIFWLLCVSILVVGTVGAFVYLKNAERREFEKTVGDSIKTAKDKHTGGDKTYPVGDESGQDSSDDQTVGVVHVSKDGHATYIYIHNDSYVARGSTSSSTSDAPITITPKPGGTDTHTPPAALTDDMVSLITPTEALDMGDTYNVLLEPAKSYPSTVISTKYTLSRTAERLGSSSAAWQHATSVGTGYQLLHVSLPDPGYSYVHVLLKTVDGRELEVVSQPIHVALEESARTTELAQYVERIGETQLPATTDARVDLDFIQPWLYSESSQSDIMKDFRVLKRAGYRGVVLQSVAKVSGGAEGEVGIQELWYKTNQLDEYTNTTTISHDTVRKVLDAAERVGLDVYLGSSDSDNWWDEARTTNSSWIEKNATLDAALFADLENTYGDSSALKGWYWTPEMYSNPSNLEQSWSVYLNSVLASLNTHSTARPLVVSPFISSQRYVSEDTWRSNWNAFVDNTHFRTGDIVALQDGLMTAELTVDEVLSRWSIVKEGVERKEGLSFYLNIENFFAHHRGSIENFKNQTILAERVAKGLLSFSYTHYASPIRNEPGSSVVDDQYDKAYRAYVGLDTSHDVPITALSAPAGGSVYVDVDGNEAPIPAGFSVSTNPNERRIQSGLVVLDASDNQFVWVPVTDWQARAKGYVYTDDEYKSIYFSRYLQNGVDLGGVSEGSMPSGVSSQLDQVQKYSGFYIARYEASFDYNNGNPRAASKPVSSNNAVPSFAWQYADSAIYNARLWNNISSTDARSKASAMADQYGYDESIRTGLVTGEQFDTYLKWVHANDSSFSLVNDGRSWGNYTDSTGAATSGNYEAGVLQGTGSNTAWSANNVYDIAGNLAEWTNEHTDPGQYIIRSNGYEANGQYGGPTYALASDAYAFSHIGFRMVLYIK